MQALATGELLNAWEQGRSRHPLDRGLLLYALAAPGVEPDTLADRPLGWRNAALLQLRQATFGGRLRAYLDCPQCGGRLEFEHSAADLLAAHPPSAEPVGVGGWQFRPPTSRDLALIADAADVESAAYRLLHSCLVPGAGDPPSVEELLPWLDRVEDALEQADPLADISLAFACAICGHAWAGAFDIAHYLWEEVEAQAARLLDEVHVLARAYGWREPEILALTDARRAAYLARVAA